MHRSGTSLVGNIVQTANIHMGEELLGSSISNVDGHFEDTHLIDLNDETLRYLECAWNTPPGHILAEDDVTKGIMSNYQIYANKRSDDASVWAAKDPRLCFTIPLLHTFLTDPHYIVCHRDAGEVAKSLSKRDGISFEEAIKLKKQYDDAIESFFSAHPKQKRFDIDYATLMLDPHTVIKDLFAFLNIKASRSLIRKARNKVRSTNSLTKEKSKYQQNKIRIK